MELRVQTCRRNQFRSR